MFVVRTSSLSSRLQLNWTSPQEKERIVRKKNEKIINIWKHRSWLIILGANRSIGLGELEIGEI